MWNFLNYLSKNACNVYGHFRVEVRDFSQWLGNTYQVYECVFVYVLSRRGWSSLIEKFFPLDFVQVFQTNTAREPKCIGILSLFEEKENFKLDYYGVVNFCASSTWKQAVNEKMKKMFTKIIYFHDFCWIIQKFVRMIQLNCYSKQKVCTFQCREPHLSISIGWNVMSISILKKKNEISKKLNFSSFLRFQILMIFSSEWDRNVEFTELKRAIYFPSVTSVQFMSNENNFWSNLTKMMKIKGFSARFSQYFMNCLLLRAASTKTNYIIVI